MTTEQNVLPEMQNLEQVVSPETERNQDTPLEPSIAYDERNQRFNTKTFRIVLVVVACVLGSLLWSFYFTMQENKLLKKEQFLDKLKRRHLYIQAELIKHERASAIQQSAQRFHLDLELSTVPPYEIITTDED